MAVAARTWASAVGERLGLPVTMRDERLSSFEAERRLGRMPRGRSGGPPTKTQRTAFRARIDREAASVILQDELDVRREAVGAAAVRPVLPAPGVADGDPEETR
jgi:RNase H-fold protein (predicted Holliday junction resolvase)